MKTTLLFVMLALLLTLGVQAQIDPPMPPAYGFLRLCGFEGQVALRELPEPGAAVYTMLQADDLIEPLNELDTDENDVEWRRVKASLWDGWMRTRKANGAEIAVCLSSN